MSEITWESMLQSAPDVFQEWQLDVQHSQVETIDRLEMGPHHYEIL